MSAKAKAKEVGVSLSGLRKTRHLYKYIKKGPRKYLYYSEDPKEIVRPNLVNVPVAPFKSRSERKRNVSFGQENYHKALGGSGNSLQRLNQLRSKIAYEGSIPPDQAQYLDEGMEETIRTKSKEVIETKRARLQMETQRETEEIQRIHNKRNLTGIYDCGTKKYPYTLTDYYDQKEKILGPSRDTLVADYIRRKRNSDSSFKPFAFPGYCDEPKETPEEGPVTFYDDKGKFIRTVK